MNSRYTLLSVSLLIALILIAPLSANSGIRPLIRHMLENLANLDAIGIGLALDEYDQIEEAASELEDRAQLISKIDIATLDLPRERDPQFDAYLVNQGKSARAIRKAASKKDGQAVLRALKSLKKEACVACHREFRDNTEMMQGSARFMTNLLNSWKNINRGVMVNDYALITRSAQDIQTMGRVFGWSHVAVPQIESEDPKNRKAFQNMLDRLEKEAYRLEKAAIAKDQDLILEATHDMWSKACLGCHSLFRQ